MSADDRAPVSGRTPSVQGWCDSRLRRVREVFTEHFTQGDEVGAAVCVYIDDDLVVDLWGGVADIRTGRLWRHDTPCVVFSCTKALTAACALQLWERGAYEIDGPVTEWWPEFGQAGKDKATAAHLLSHQAGLPAFDTPVSVAESADPAALADRLAAQAPVWEPGTAHGYHAVTFGWLAGEIVRRLSGQTVGAYIAGHIAGPHGLDLWLGPPANVTERAAKLTRRRLGEDRRPAARGAGGSPSLAPAAAMPGNLGARSSLLQRAVNNPDVASVPRGSNNPAVIRAGWPASGALASAAGLAGFYRQLIAGRILGPATLTAALVTRVSGPDRVLDLDSAFGLGFMLPTSTFPAPQAARQSAFGHTGLGGSIGLGDVTHKIAIAYVPNRLGSEVSGEQRAARLVAAVYDAVA